MASEVERVRHELTTQLRAEQEAQNRLAATLVDMIHARDDAVEALRRETEASKALLEENQKLQAELASLKEAKP